MAQSNRTAYAVLGFLTRGPMSGYDIKKAVEGSVDNFWSESFGQIYPTLRRLSDEELIDKEEATTPGGRPRHVYAINDAGRAALAQWLRDDTPPPPVRIELLLKLFFGIQADRETNRAQILAYRERMTSDLARYRAISEALRAEKQGNAELPYWLLTLRFGERDRQAHIDWCDEALEILDQLPNSDHAHGSSPFEEWAR